MTYLVNILITLLIILISYKIIKYYNTDYKYTTLEILKDINNSKIINKIVNEDLKHYDYVSIGKEEIFIFGKLYKSELYINKGFYMDFDDDYNY